MARLENLVLAKQLLTLAQELTIISPDGMPGSAPQKRDLTVAPPVIPPSDPFKPGVLKGSEPQNINIISPTPMGMPPSMAPMQPMQPVEIMPPSAPAPMGMPPASPNMDLQLPNVLPPAGGPLQIKSPAVPSLLMPGQDSMQGPGLDVMKSKVAVGPQKSAPAQGAPQPAPTAVPPAPPAAKPAAKPVPPPAAPAPAPRAATPAAPPAKPAPAAPAAKPAPAAPAAPVVAPTKVAKSTMAPMPAPAKAATPPAPATPAKPGTPATPAAPNAKPLNKQDPNYKKLVQQLADMGADVTSLK